MRRVWSGLLALLLSLLVALPASAAVTGSAQLLGGHIGDEGWGALMVELRNDGRELNGNLIVSRVGQQGEPPSVVTSLPLTLAAGGTKRVPLPFAYGFNAGRFGVRFEVDGKAVFATEGLSSTKEPGLYVIGLLTDDERGIAGLDGYRVQTTGQGLRGEPLVDARVEVARIDPEQLPVESTLLDVFDAILLYRYQTERLNPEQRAALATWVGAGGMLILGGGPEWKATLSPLPEGLLPVTITGVGTADLGGLGALVTGKGAPTAGPISQANVTKGERLANADGSPLVVSSNYGAGRVVYLAADPGLAPLSTWEGTAPLLANLLEVKPTVPWKDQSFRAQQMTQPLQMMGALALPPGSVLFGLLLLYVVVIGPLSYWLLKGRDRRELLWVSVPVLSILFVAGAWLGSGGRRSGLMGSVITVTELYPGTGSGRLSTYVGLYSPTAERLQVPLPAESLVRPLNDYDQSWRESVISLGNKPSLALNNVTTYGLTSFTLSRDVKLPEGLVIVDARVEGNSLIGQLKNNLNQRLEQVTVALGGDSSQLGTLEAGATSTPFSLNLQLLGRPNLMMEGWGPVRTTEERMRMRKLQVLQSFVNGPDPTEREMAELQVFAWLERPLVAQELKVAASMEEGPHLLWQRMQAPVAKGGLR